MKKFLVALLIVSCLFTLAACGSGGSSGSPYDDTALKDRIAQLEQELADMRSGAGTSTIYSLGETAFVYSNGIKVFSIKYVSANPDDTHSFEVTNFSLPSSITSDYIYAIIVYINSGSSSLTTHGHDYLRKDENCVITTGPTNPGGVEKYIYFSYDSNRIPYAIFEITHL
jgi:predicted small lipoprotein YifL